MIAQAPHLFVLYGLAGLAAMIVIWLVAVYNGLVRIRQHVRESWSNVDTELKRRYDLIPNLVEVVKGYAAHEQQCLQAVIDARTRAVASTGSPADQAREENMLVGSVRQLLARAEAYPDLKASENFLQLQRQLVMTEDRIQAARRFYNGNVRDLNTRCQTFPATIVAGMFGFKRADFFEIDDAGIRQAVHVNL